MNILMVLAAWIGGAVLVGIGWSRVQHAIGKPPSPPTGPVWRANADWQTDDLHDDDAHRRARSA
jgi:hypothetical protein